MTESMNVVLFNAWHDDNKGDAAITDGTLRILRHAFEHHGVDATFTIVGLNETCLLYTSPSPRDQRGSRMPSSA